MTRSIALLLQIPSDWDVEIGTIGTVIAQSLPGRGSSIAWGKTVNGEL
ncbi:hypothetical protein PAESOLCIP111_05495 [Paenibacillus solanacearum]|uniref:Uncharacterized protein n=1 Tax=Paenibacillus solanacearum TaxID=2048548 RepID=A0A916NRJ5_9BACL|nr:hypothetical protein [Paenibacillus solanacearum]CAG7647964.1 hypothetical protein PAESOLCIP111_05495 [Paenibacillus solanacearum]